MAAVHNPIETLLNEDDVARITGLSVASVRRWRLLRQGPKYLKIGRGQLQAGRRFRMVGIPPVWRRAPGGAVDGGLCHHLHFGRSLHVLRSARPAPEAMARCGMARRLSDPPRQER